MYTRYRSLANISSLAAAACSSSKIVSLSVARGIIQSAGAHRLRNRQTHSRLAECTSALLSNLCSSPRCLLTIPPIIASLYSQYKHTHTAAACRETGNFFARRRLQQHRDEENTYGHRPRINFPGRESLSLACAWSCATRGKPGLRLMTMTSARAHEEEEEVKEKKLPCAVLHGSHPFLPEYYFYRLPRSTLIFFFFFLHFHLSRPMCAFYCLSVGLTIASVAPRRFVFLFVARAPFFQSPRPFFVNNCRCLCFARFLRT